MDYTPVVIILQSSEVEVPLPQNNFVGAIARFSAPCAFATRVMAWLQKELSKALWLLHSDLMNRAPWMDE